MNEEDPITSDWPLSGFVLWPSVASTNLASLNLSWNNLYILLATGLDEVTA